MSTLDDLTARVERKILDKNPVKPQGSIGGITEAPLSSVGIATIGAGSDGNFPYVPYNSTGTLAPSGTHSGYWEGIFGLKDVNYSSDVVRASNPPPPITQWSKLDSFDVDYDAEKINFDREQAALERSQIALNNLDRTLADILNALNAQAEYDLEFGLPFYNCTTIERENALRLMWRQKIIR